MRETWTVQSIFSYAPSHCVLFKYVTTTLLDFIAIWAVAKYHKGSDGCCCCALHFSADVRRGAREDSNRKKLRIFYTYSSHFWSSRVDIGECKRLHSQSFALSLDRLTNINRGWINNDDLCNISLFFRLFFSTIELERNELVFVHVVGWLWNVEMLSRRPTVEWNFEVKIN